MIENQEEILRNQRSLAYTQVLKTFRKLEKLRLLHHAMEERYYFEKGEFERIDRELAMVDGRYQRLAEAEQREKDKKLVTRLSTKQLLKIADALDVELEVD